MTTMPFHLNVGALYNATVGGTVLAPSSLATDDIELMVMESQAGTHTLTTANGFAELGTQIDVPSGTATIATHGSLWWRRYAGQADPVCGSPTNHILARRWAIRGAIATGLPFDEIGGAGVFTVQSSEAVEDTSGSHAGGTTTIDQCLRACLFGGAKPDSLSTTDISAQACTGITTVGQWQGAGNAGNGGILACIFDSAGGSIPAGAFGPFTYTKAAASFKWGYAVAVIPIPDPAGGAQIAQAGVIGA